MAMQGKLASKDRLLKWSVVDNATCVLCRNGALESHNHLFFDCTFSRAVWKEILQRIHIHRGPLMWEDEKKWFLLHSKGKTIRESILKLSLDATVYGVWCERNMMIFQQKMMEADLLGSKICNNIRDAMMAWRNINSTQENKVLFRAWGVPFPRLSSTVEV
ncbi:uncharacterized protein LOC131311586 [Rhododendron vialii]|uniref:uncharacterized protein LOC131311586 n=1 Tax=Rhododendron vialii TaxID=182163 RepID=UPI00265E9F88|nr:uncharacterized protein LOC131311586 [Rhododendron vialii]